MATSYFFLKLLEQKQSIESRPILYKKKLSSRSLNQCRICLKEGSVPIFSTSTSRYPDISEAVSSFGNIQLNEDDGFPKLLCDACFSLLRGAILFRKSAKETEFFLLANKHKANLNLQTEIDVNDTRSDMSDENNTLNKDKFDSASHKCKLCKLNFKTYAEYLAHNNSKEHKKVRIQCRICHRLLTAQLYKKHIARHQSASHLVCDVCGKLFRKDNLVRHLQLHSYDLPYQCQICPYRGRFTESLKIHMLTHSGDKPYSCDKCNLKFLTRSNLNRHLLTHKKEKPFKCMGCNKTFYTQRDVDIHFKCDHAGIKEFNCHICENKYGTRKAMMRHELRFHKRDKMAKGRMPLYLQPEFRK